VYFFPSGLVSDIPVLVDAYCSLNYSAKGDCEALVVDDGVLYYAGLSLEDGFWRIKLEFNKTRAIGSGRDHALTAMDMGATAKEAVKWAMKRDTGTGGRIRTYKL